MTFAVLAGRLGIEEETRTTTKAHVHKDNEEADPI